MKNFVLVKLDVISKCLRQNKMVVSRHASMFQLLPLKIKFRHSVTNITHHFISKSIKRNWAVEI
jgi:hypothetical protein